MKVKGVSFSKYKVKLDTYTLEKLDLFAFLFTKIILNENLNKELKIIDYLKDLGIKEDLFYLFNNIYYKFVDNKIIDCLKEDLNEVYLKDIKIKNRFKERLVEGKFTIFNEEIEKEFVYDYLDNKVVLEKINYDESNVCVLSIDNSLEKIEKIVNDNQKGLILLEDGFCVLKDFSVDPYYFDINLDIKDNMFVCKERNKEKIYNALKDNSLFINDNYLKGDILTNNIYFKCLYGDIRLKEYSDYLFVNDKNQEGNIKDNIIYVNYEFDKGDFIDLIRKESYKCGWFLLEDNTKVSTYIKEKEDKVSSFKLYLIKNKAKFKENIEKIIELI